MSEQLALELKDSEGGGDHNAQTSPATAEAIASTIMFDDERGVWVDTETGESWSQDDLDEELHLPAGTKRFEIKDEDSADWYGNWKLSVENELERRKEQHKAKIKELQNKLKRMAWVYEPQLETFARAEMEKHKKVKVDPKTGEQQISYRQRNLKLERCTIKFTSLRGLYENKEYLIKLDNAKALDEWVNGLPTEELELYGIKERTETHVVRDFSEERLAQLYAAGSDEIAGMKKLPIDLLGSLKVSTSTVKTKDADKADE